MARYNSVNSTGSVAGGNSITTPYSGLLTTLTGSGTVTVPNPVYYTGQIQTFYNSTLSAITLSTPSGNFIAPGFTSATTLSLPSASVFTVVSDGTNYIVQDWLGGIGKFTSLSASGGTVTLSGTTLGSIDNITIGATTAAAGTFNGLTNTAGTTSLAGGSASGVFTFSSSQGSSAYNNGAVVISNGGLGVAGNVYVNGISVVGTYGTPTTGAGFRTNTTDIYGQAAATDKIRLSITGDSWFNGGKLGVGNTNPSYTLDITGTARFTNTITAAVALNTGDGDSNNPFFFSQDYSSWASLWAGTAGSGNGWGLFWAGNSGAKYGTNGTGGPGNIWTNSGNPNEAVFVGNGITRWTCRLDDGQVWQQGNLYVGGNVYSSYSDLRLKNVIKPIENSLENLAKIDTFYYEPNDLAKSLGVTGGITIGVSTQSVKLVYPEIVGPSPVNKDYDTVQYEKLVPVLIDAINRLNSKVEYLENKLKDQ